jgi:2,4-dienoyl-CoA reductase-like NADH-dependent reductase (Old Yellow Enzyme family)
LIRKFLFLFHHRLKLKNNMPSTTTPSQAVQPQATNTHPATGSVLSPITKDTPKLFNPITSKSVTFKNRIILPALCQYSATDGFLNDYHVAHYGSYAIKGVGMVIIEATGVEARGRISQHDSGLWSDEHIPPLKRVVDILKSQGTVPAIQIAHAGRKASMSSGWFEGGYHRLSEEEQGWPNDVVGPSDLPFDDHHATPRALTIPEMQEITQKFVEAAIRADKAGIEVLEIHSAHG